ncbi:alpha/beta hydrolase [Dyella sp. C11]|uniref:alpha/beta fold hydrolase n=1 Tax=Dyella sp. C11 TaxID=2126991 RepID=UPI000D64D353|nr:alpha/beta hydrolase [Dyella sp. C11]
MESRLSNCRFVKIRGHRMAYRVCGPEAGPAVMLIHAFASQSATWRNIAPALARSGFRVVAPDLRGHGRSARTACYALAEFDQDLIALLDALELEKVSLAGHSLGGHLALRLAAHRPERVEQMVIEAAPVPPRDAEDAAAIAAARPGSAGKHALQRLGVGRLLRLVLLRQFDVRSARSVLAELKAPMPGWWQRVATLPHPCLLMASHDDGLVSARLSLLANALPNATVLRLGSGHHLHGEHRETFLAAMLSFFRKNTDASPATFPEPSPGLYPA